MGGVGGWRRPRDLRARRCPGCLAVGWGVGLFHAVSMAVMMVGPAARSVSFVAYSIAQLRLLLLFMVCAFLFLVFCLCLFGVSAPRAGLLGGGVAACAPVYGGGGAGAGAVVAVFVVSLHGCEG